MVETVFGAVEVHVVESVDELHFIFNGGILGRWYAGVNWVSYLKT